MAALQRSALLNFSSGAALAAHVEKMLVVSSVKVFACMTDLKFCFVILVAFAFAFALRVVEVWRPSKRNKAALNLPNSGFMALLVIQENCVQWGVVSQCYWTVTCHFPPTSSIAYSCLKLLHVRVTPARFLNGVCFIMFEMLAQLYPLARTNAAAASA